MRLSKLEKGLLVKPGVRVKLLMQDNELQMLDQSAGRMAEERAMRQRQFNRLGARLALLSLGLRIPWCR